MEHDFIIINSDNQIEITTDLNAIRQRLIAKAIASPGGRAALAASMINPIRRSLDYQGIARRAFLVDPLPQGALPTYDKDDILKFEHDEIVISSDNKLGKRSFNFPVQRVTVPEFEIYANPTIKISDVKHRRFSLIDRDIKDV